MNDNQFNRANHPGAPPVHFPGYNLGTNGMMMPSSQPAAPLIHHPGYNLAMHGMMTMQSSHPSAPPVHHSGYGYAMNGLMMMPSSHSSAPPVPCPGYGVTMQHSGFGYYGMGPPSGNCFQYHPSGHGVGIGSPPPPHK